MKFSSFVIGSTLAVVELADSAEVHTRAVRRPRRLSFDLQLLFALSRPQFGQRHAVLQRDLAKTFSVSLTAQMGNVFLNASNLQLVYSIHYSKAMLFYSAQCRSTEIGMASYPECN